MHRDDGHSAESAPLLPSKRRTIPTAVRRSHLATLAFLLFVLLIAQNIGWFPSLADASHAEQRATRRQWEKERNGWQEEKVAHKILVRKTRQQWKEERNAWNTEKAVHDAVVEETRQQWNEERDAWKEEKAAHQTLAREWARERAQFEREMRRSEEKLAEWRQVEREWEERRREEELRRKEIERRREGTYWTMPIGDPGCVAYGTRIYRAHLKDIPWNVPWLEVCADMPVRIHGRGIDKPDNCTRDVSGFIHAYWDVPRRGLMIRPG